MSTLYVARTGTPIIVTLSVEAWDMGKKQLKVLYNTCVEHMAQWSGGRPATERLLVQTPLWSLNVASCALGQDTLSTFSQSTQVKLGTSLCWE